MFPYAFHKRTFIILDIPKRKLNLKALTAFISATRHVARFLELRPYFHQISHRKFKR